jgi:hypothetical protein
VWGETSTKGSNPSLSATLNLSLALKAGPLMSFSPSISTSTYKSDEVSDKNTQIFCLSVHFFRSTGRRFRAGAFYRTSMTFLPTTKNSLQPLRLVRRLLQSRTGFKIKPYFNPHDLNIKLTFSEVLY